MIVDCVRVRGVIIALLHQIDFFFEMIMTIVA